MEEYPSLVEGTGLENREVGDGAGVRIPLSPPFKIVDIAEWSSLVARRAHNPKVVGSNPAPATKVVSWCSGYHVCLSRRRSPVRTRSEPPFFIWLCSSVGRARDWKSLCRWFDSTRSHHFKYIIVMHALVAQLDRAFDYGSKGFGFDSWRAHHNIGKWLNLVEHLVWDQGVAGSNPVFPTIR